MDINSLKRDSSAVSEGVWVDEIPQMGDLRLKVRGFTSREVMECRSAKERNVPITDRNRDGSILIETGMRITREIMLEAILLDWGKIEDGGAEVEYTKKQAEAWLLDIDYTPFADAVAWAASYVDRLRDENRKAAAKNSGKSSSGK